MTFEQRQAIPTPIFIIGPAMTNVFSTWPVGDELVTAAPTVVIWGPSVQYPSSEP